MYIHLGNNYIISAPSIIAILNYEPPVSTDVRDIVEIARMEKNLVSISEKGKEKAVVICDQKVYLSPISSTTLYKRAFHHLKEA
ncbi:MAG: DUF370 domain-containing protein [Syntrophomonadaceae bacterium]|jgi:regulator of extracellular matrix RemA (YlzA/DUF370 family)|nr:DUF370 domain-containing protein [Syntrophomonadaceae bacterium]